MFVKYLHESDLIERKFIASNESNLHPESFHRMEFNEASGISTLMTVYTDSNLYFYSVATEREGTIDRGSITKKEQLDRLIFKYFDDDYVSFLERKKGKSYSLIEKSMLRKRVKPLPCEFKDIAKGITT